MYPTVILDLIGFWIPFIISADIVIALGLIIRRHRITVVGLAKYVGLILWVAILTVIFFLVSGNKAGIPQSYSFLIIIISTLSYGGLFYRSRAIFSSVLECYVVGVYAEILSDFARTFIVPVSFSPVYWGGYGTGDLIFQLGLWMGFLYLLGGVILASIYAIIKRNLNTFIEKLIGRRLLDWMRKK